MDKVIRDIQRFFIKVNPTRKGQKDYQSIQTNPREMISIAGYLYYLDSYGIKGDLLECGCFKGFSSCCLSWACDFLGKKLLIADSFQGLPEGNETVTGSYYQPSDFKGELEEVKTNIATLGKINSTEFIVGWFNESLKGFNRPISILWIDVDLYHSTLDVLNNVFSSLAQDGVIFSHEFSCDYIKNTEIKSDVGGPARAIADFFSNIQINYKAKFVADCLALIIPHVAAEEGIIKFTSCNNSFIKLIEFHEIIKRPKLKSLKLISSSTHYALDTINGINIHENSPLNLSSDILIITGWAIDKELKDCAGGVYICIDGKPYWAEYGRDRIDVANAYKHPQYQKSGFECCVPVSEIGSGQHTLSIKIVTQNKKAHYAPKERIQFTIL